MDDTLNDVMQPLRCEFEAMQASIGADVDISTMTLSFKLSHTVDVNSLYTKIREGDCQLFAMTMGATPFDFPNQVSLVVAKSGDFQKRKAKPRHKLKVSGVNVKVCSNGSLNVTGCKDLNEAHVSISTVTRCLLFNKCVSSDSTLTRSRVSLVNLLFSVGDALHLAKVVDLLRKRDISCQFDPARYAGVVVHADHGYAFIYASGKVTCGSSTLGNVPTLLHLLRETLSKSSSDIVRVCEPVPSSAS